MRIGEHALGRDSKRGYRRLHSRRVLVADARNLHAGVLEAFAKQVAHVHVIGTIASATGPADPILLEIFNHRFAGIAEQMGLTLRNTASSVNVKERLDFSCAIFTAAGDLVVNAPHIPVHLGAMSETVRRVLGDNPAASARRRGGDKRSLPRRLASARRHRVPAIHDRAGRLVFFTASRAHHAEIGGIAPGSMPPESRNSGRGRGRDSQFPAVHRRPAALGRAAASCSPPAPFRAATCRPIWPTSPPRWPPIAAVPAIWTSWSSVTPGRSWRPTSNTFSKRRPKRSAGHWPASLPARGGSSTISTTARRSSWQSS